MITIEVIKREVAQYRNMTVATLESKSRIREIVEARHTAMHLARELTDKTLKYIGKHIGNKDHCTVLHACDTISNILDIDKQFKSEYDEIWLNILLSTDDKIIITMPLDKQLILCEAKIKSYKSKLKLKIKRDSNKKRLIKIKKHGCNYK